MDVVKIGKFLQELRKEKNITQEQFAEKMSVSRRTVSRWETGRNMPDLTLLIEIADFYAVDVREILEGERKNEGANMTDETKKTLRLVADYTELEQDKITRELSLCNIAAVIGFLVLWIVPVIIDVIPELNLETKHSSMGSFVYFISLFGLVFASTGFIRALQIRGSLSKSRTKRIRQILVPLTICILLLCTIGVILLTALVAH